MSQTNYVFASAGSLEELAIVVAAYIADGYFATGTLTKDGQTWIQAMAKGSGTATFEDLDARTDALEAINTPVLLSADGAISPTTSSQSIITKASAAALTLALNATNGIRLKISSGTSAAHVITATGLLQDGSNEAGNTITFANKKGASVELLSYGSKWLVVAGNHYTVA